MKKLFFILLVGLTLISCDKETKTSPVITGEWDEIEHTENGFPVTDFDNDPTNPDLIITDNSVFDKGYINNSSYTYEDCKITYQTVGGTITYKVSMSGSDLIFNSNTEYRRFEKH